MPEYPYEQVAPSGIIVRSTTPFNQERAIDRYALAHIQWSYRQWLRKIYKEYRKSWGL